MSRQLKLILFIYPGGHHEAAWRFRDSEPDRDAVYVGAWRLLREVTPESRRPARDLRRVRSVCSRE